MSSANSDDPLSLGTLQSFAAVWSKFDPGGTGLIHASHIDRLLCDLGAPLGFDVEERSAIPDGNDPLIVHERSARHALLFSFNATVINDHVAYTDAYRALTERLLGPEESTFAIAHATYKPAAQVRKMLLQDYLALWRDHLDENDVDDEEVLPLPFSKWIASKLIVSFAKKWLLRTRGESVDTAIADPFTKGGTRPERRSILNDFSAHADGERRGLVADPSGGVGKLWVRRVFRYHQIGADPSALAVGMLRDH